VQPRRTKSDRKQPIPSPGVACSRLGHIASPKAEPHRYGEENLWYEETNEEVANHGGQSEDAHEICPTAGRRTFEGRSKKRKAEEPHIRGRIPTVHNCRDAETRACGKRDYLRERPNPAKLTVLEDPIKKTHGDSASGQDCESE
jgi:hypothetical protein